MMTAKSIGLGMFTVLLALAMPGLMPAALACRDMGIEDDVQLKEQRKTKASPQFVGITRCPSALNQASEQFRAGDHEAALAALSELIEQSPEVATAWINRATVHMSLAQYSLALADVEWALGLAMVPAHRARAMEMRLQILRQLE